jgi:hypothetical protein
MGFLRARAAVFGIILTVGSGLAMSSGISHQLQGVATTATVLDHSSECRVEYQLVVSDHRSDLPMDCDAATAFQNRLGSNKVILHRNDFVKLRYAEPDGRMHTVKVVAANVVAHAAPNGSSIPVVYDPIHPDDVKAPLTMNVLGLEFLLFLGGLYLLSLGLGIGPVRVMRALMGGSRSAPAPAAARMDWSEESVGERLRAAAAQAASAPSSPAPWQSPSAAPAERPVASPWATANSDPQFGRASASSFGKRRA